MFEDGPRGRGAPDSRHGLSPPPSSPSNRTDTNKLSSCWPGELTPREAVFYAQRNTRQYAKRQITWFAAKDVVWLPGFADEPRIRQAALERVALFLAAVMSRNLFQIPSSDRVCTRRLTAKNLKQIR